MDTINNIENKKIIDSWLSFTESLEPAFSKLTFFPENGLPYPKSVYLKAFSSEYLIHNTLGTLTPEILISIATNVGNVHRFSRLVDEKSHILYAQNLMDNPELIKNQMAYPLLDVYLQQDLASGLLEFCKEEKFPKKIMHSANALFFTNMLKEGYTSSYFKSLFINHENESLLKILNNEKKATSEGIVNKSLEKKSSQWFAFFITSLIWIGIFYFLVGK